MELIVSQARVCLSKQLSSLLLLPIILLLPIHSVKYVRIRSYSGPNFPAFRLNMERYSVSLRIQSKCGKMRTRITPNTDTFDAVIITKVFLDER